MVLADRELSDWTRWLITSTNLGAQETLLFLERAFIHLPRNAQRRVVRRLHNADGINVDALLYELLVYEVCYGLDLSPAFEPDIKGQTPDLALMVAGQKYIADVFVTNRPKKTLIEFGGSSEYRDSGEAAKKLADICFGKGGQVWSVRDPPDFIRCIHGP